MRQHPPGSDHRILNLWQSEKSMTNSTDTRRGFLSTAAALAASAAATIPANAANALGADPILKAIEAHKVARLAFENAFSRGCARSISSRALVVFSFRTNWTNHGRPRGCHTAYITISLERS
jgi:hypothetical protein